MESNHISYDFEKSRQRLDDILNNADNVYEELTDIPSRDKLTYNNGFYVSCTAIIVDIRKSSELPSKHQKATLAKIYRMYISEIVALLNGNSDCVEINIHGDSVWGVFKTPYTRDIDQIFSTAAKISSLIDTLNCKLKKKKISTIEIGIGIDYGTALMIKAGYNGSGINDVVWMGDVVNKASKLCSYGNREWFDKELMVSGSIYANLNKDNQALLTWNDTRSCYNGNMVNIVMNDWNDKNCS